MDIQFNRNLFFQMSGGQLDNNVLHRCRRRLRCVHIRDRARILRFRGDRSQIHSVDTVPILLRDEHDEIFKRHSDHLNHWKLVPVRRCCDSRCVRVERRDWR